MTARKNPKESPIPPLPLLLKGGYVSTRYIHETWARAIAVASIIVLADVVANVQARVLLAPVIVRIVTLAGVVVLAFVLWVDLTSAWSYIAIAGRSKGCHLSKTGVLGVRGMGLKSLLPILCHPKIALLVTAIDAAHNDISDFGGLARFKNVQRINLDYNYIQSMSGFPNLQALSSLSIRHNKIDTRPAKMGIEPDYFDNPFLVKPRKQRKPELAQEESTRPGPKKAQVGAGGRAIPVVGQRSPTSTLLIGTGKGERKRNQKAAARAAKLEQERKAREERQRAAKEIAERVAKARASHVPLDAAAMAAEIARIEASPRVGSIPSDKGLVNHFHARKFAKALDLMKKPFTTFEEMTGYFKFVGSHEEEFKALIHELDVMDVVAVDEGTIVFLKKEYTVPSWSRFDDVHVKAFHVDVEKMPPGPASIPVPDPERAAELVTPTLPMHEQPLVVKDTTGSRRKRAGGSSAGGNTHQKTPASPGKKGEASGKRTKHGGSKGLKRKETKKESKAEEALNLQTRTKGVLKKAAATRQSSISMDALKTSVNAVEGRKLKDLKAYLVRLERQGFVQVAGGDVVILQKLRAAGESWVSPDKFVHRKLEADEAKRIGNR